jgi:hypothetical protein
MKAEGNFPLRQPFKRDLTVYIKLNLSIKYTADMRFLWMHVPLTMMQTFFLYYNYKHLQITFEIYAFPANFKIAKQEREFSP